jgi:multicomponent Na+:H+ antiporter subunit E
MGLHILALFFVLLAVWVLLSGQFTWLHLGSGIVSSVLVTYVAIRKRIADKEGQPVHLVAAALLYWPWLLYQIFLANIDVAYRVWHPRLPISPRLIKVPLKTKTDLGTVIYANSITLTPGTVTVDVFKSSLLVHALSADGAKSLLEEEMQKQVLKLERHA